MNNDFGNIYIDPLEVIKEAIYFCRRVNYSDIDIIIMSEGYFDTIRYMCMEEVQKERQFDVLVSNTKYNEFLTNGSIYGLPVYKTTAPNKIILCGKTQEILYAIPTEKLSIIENIRKFRAEPQIITYEAKVKLDKKEIPKTERNIKRRKIDLD